MHSELLDNDLESNSKYKLAGYLAIVSGVLLIPVVVIGILYAIPALHNPAMLSLIIVFTVIQAFCGLYAFYRFKNFLNEYYDFHDIDKLVLPIILLQIVINLFSLLSKITTDLNFMQITGIMSMITAGVTAILIIIFSLILLRLQVSLHGLLKPFAYLNIAACICFLTFFLGPIGVILAVVTDIMLGIIFLKTPERLEVEFV